MDDETVFNCHPTIQLNPIDTIYTLINFCDSSGYFLPSEILNRILERKEKILNERLLNWFYDEFQTCIYNDDRFPTKKVKTIDIAHITMMELISKKGVKIKPCVLTPSDESFLRYIDSITSAYASKRNEFKIDVAVMIIFVCSIYLDKNNCQNLSTFDSTINIDNFSDTDCSTLESIRNAVCHSKIDINHNTNNIHLINHLEEHGTLIRHLEGDIEKTKLIDNYMKCMDKIELAIINPNNLRVIKDLHENLCLVISSGFVIASKIQFFGYILQYIALYETRFDVTHNHIRSIENTIVKYGGTTNFSGYYKIPLNSKTKGIWEIRNKLAHANYIFVNNDIQIQFDNGAEMISLSNFISIYNNTAITLGYPFISFNLVMLKTFNENIKRLQYQ